MKTRTNLSRLEKLDILRRLITKFSTSQLSRSEKLDALRRLITKLSTSKLSKPEVMDILKRIIKKYSTNGPVETSKNLGDESRTGIDTVAKRDI